MRVVGCLFSILFLGVADNQILSPLLPFIREALGRSSQDMGLLFTGYALSAGLSVLLWGPLSDLFGRKPGLLTGLVTFAIGSAISFSSETFAGLMGGRVVAGLGASMLSLNTLSYAADYFPYESRGWAMGSIVSSYFAALILGVPLGSWVAEHFGWKAVFALAGATALILLGSTFWMLPESGVRRPVSVPRRFLTEQARSYFRFVATGRTAGALVSAFFASAGVMGFLAFVGAWLHDSFGLSPREISYVFLASGAAALVASPFAGSLSDRVGKRPQFVLSNLTLAFLLVLLPGLDWGPLLIATFMAVSLSAAFRQGPMEALISEVVTAGRRGSFIALKNAFSQLGIGLSALLSGLLFEWDGYRAVCLLCAAFNLAAAGSMVLLVRGRRL